MNVVDRKLKDELTRDEGKRLEAYKDSLGYWTIGIGHYLGSGSVPRMTAITQSECDALYNQDVLEATILANSVFCNFMRNGFSTNMSEEYASSRRALINMCFNLGGKIKQFKKFVTAVESGRLADAADEMMRSKWAGQVGDRALRLRKQLYPAAAPWSQ